DLCICHENRAALQDHGFQIADCQTAQTFSRERFPPGDKHFGAHGIFVLAELMDEADFETFLRTIEFGVIGKRELLDTLHVLKEKGINRGYAVKRCATEYIRRYPMDLKSASLLRHLL